MLLFCSSQPHRPKWNWHSWCGTPGSAAATARRIEVWPSLTTPSTGTPITSATSRSSGARSPAVPDNRGCKPKPPKMRIPMKPPGYTDLKPPGMVSSRRPLSSCHAGEVWVKRLPPTWFAFLLVAAVAAGWLALGQVGEVEIDDGLECFGCSATA